MTRYPELTHKASQDPDVARMRHFALDRMTAAHIQVGLLNRQSSVIDAVAELDREEKTIEALEDAAYYFRTYLRAKLKKYEQLLQLEGEAKDHTIEKGNEIIKATKELAKERGIQ